MANRMYVAIGLDKEQLEMCEHPKSSPYMQTAHLIFARHDKEAFAKAKRRLGNPPRIVKQIGIFCADDVGKQQFNAGRLGDKVDSVTIVDNNDTQEGILVSLVNPKVGKRSLGCEHWPEKAEMQGGDQLEDGRVIHHVADGIVFLVGDNNPIPFEHFAPTSLPGVWKLVKIKATNV